MHEAVQKLMAGDDSAEKDIDKWDQTIRMHPDYAKEQEEKRVKWEKENAAANQEALRKLRTFVPPDIFSSSVAKMTSEGVPRIVAQRIWKVKVLHWVRWHPDDVKKVHIADLQAKYSNQGLDVQEMRAVWATIPEVFDLDSDGKKAQWQSFFSTKLRELTEKEAQGKLNRNELQAPAWKGLTEGPYDPNIVLNRKSLQKSTAFDPTEKPTAATILRDRSAAQHHLGAASPPNLTSENRDTDNDSSRCPSTGPPPLNPCTPTGRANILRESSSLPGHGENGGGGQKQNMMIGSSSLLHETKNRVGCGNGGAPPPPPLPTAMAVNINGSDGARRGLMAKIQKSRGLSPTSRSQSSSQGGGCSSSATTTMDRGEAQNALFAVVRMRRGDPVPPPPSSHPSSTAVVDKEETKNALFATIKRRRVEHSHSSDGGSMADGQGGAKNALFAAIKARRIDDSSTLSPSKCSDPIADNQGRNMVQQRAPFDGTRSSRMDSPAESSQSLKVSHSGVIDDGRGKTSSKNNGDSSTLYTENMKKTNNRVNSTPIPPPLPTNGQLLPPAAERGGAEDGANALFSAIKARRADHPPSVLASAVSSSNGVVIDGSRTSGRTQNALFAAIRARRIDSPSSQRPTAVKSSKDVDGKNLLFDAIKARRVE